MDELRREARPIWGTMREADFEADTVTFDMRGDYVVAAGQYAIIPQAEYERLLAIAEAYYASEVVPISRQKDPPPNKPLSEIYWPDFETSYARFIPCDEAGVRLVRVVGESNG